MMDPSEELEIKILNRYESLLEVFNFLKTSYKWKDDIFINKGILFLTVTSYFDDIYRWKTYANLKVADRFKVAAYTIKWISKLKPIQTNYNSNTSSFILTINNFFAIYCGLNFLDLTMQDLDRISKEFLEQFMYETQYRIISGRSLSPRLSLLEKLLKAGEIA